MIEICKKEECCGCYACSNICPKKCIEMTADKEGFVYPMIDKTRCIGCNLCIKVCPWENNIDESRDEVQVFACKNFNDEIRMRSSSGGIFSVLCEHIINQKGVVFGAGFTEDFEVEHRYATSLEECEQFYGSKYVQSSIKNTYNEAKEMLNNGKKVLFSGTQCQIKGLNLFLGKKYENLITVDVICHGVPSPKVFRKYRDTIINENKSQIVEINFRDKKNGWHEFNYMTKFKDGKVISESLKKNIFMKGFLNDLYLRESCYTCKAKDGKSYSDFSLADYWGIEKVKPDIDDNKGISLVLVNSKNGYNVFNEIKNSINWWESKYESAILYNPAIIKPTKKNRHRKRYFNTFEKKNIYDGINMYINPNLINKIIWKIKDVR